jgi:hypothetical protein
MEEAIAQWREQSDARAKCNEQWRLYKSKFPELIETIKGEVSEDLIHCMKYVSTLPNDCGAILAMDSYVKHLPARMLLSEILETFARNGDYMTLVKLFIVEMVRKQW